jgi:hypothetical protein
MYFFFSIFLSILFVDRDTVFYNFVAAAAFLFEC